MEKFKLYYAQASRWAFPFAIAALIVSLFTCNRNQRQAEDRVATLEAMLDAQEKKTVQIENEKGQLVAQNEQLKTNAQDLKALTEEVFRLKEQDERIIKAGTSYSRIPQEAVFRKIDASWDDHIVPSKDGNDTAIVYVPQPADTSLIRVPRTFAYQDTTITLAGTVFRSGVRIDSMRIPNQVHFRTVIQKTGFLNLGRKTVVQAFNTNPRIGNTGITSVAVDVRPNWWHRWGEPLASAAVTGFVVNRIRSQ